ncbi:hypothetical protein BJY04DRAFT_193619 [Aspergillus karnatakaensis]|uniref:uncharacterized protein n=1 Tax=Aspergillus karnatakaensis TaxID=1810916 RepID=UPI003CCE3845
MEVSQNNRLNECMQVTTSSAIVQPTYKNDTDLFIFQEKWHIYRINSASHWPAFTSLQTTRMIEKRRTSPRLRTLQQIKAARLAEIAAAALAAAKTSTSTSTGSPAQRGKVPKGTASKQAPRRGRPPKQRSASPVPPKPAAVRWSPIMLTWYGNANCLSKKQNCSGRSCACCKKKVRKHVRPATDYWVRHMRWPPNAVHPRGYNPRNGRLPTGRKVPPVPVRPFAELKKYSGKVLTGLSGSKITRYTNSQEVPIWSGRGARELVCRGARDELYDYRFAEYARRYGVAVGCSYDNLDLRSSNLCRGLLTQHCRHPDDERFQGENLKYIIAKMRLSNETGLIHLVRDLLFPSPDIAVRNGDVQFKWLEERLAESWACSVPFDDQGPGLAARFLQGLPGVEYHVPLPQPDHTVGFNKNAFTSDQMANLQRYIDYYSISHFKGPNGIFFPFFTTEIKQKPRTLAMADLQNAHSMTVGMRGVVELYRRVHPNKVKELNGKVIGFSISLSPDQASLHAHFPVVDEQHNVEYRRVLLDSFNWTLVDHRKRCYNFAMAIYTNFAQAHRYHICSAIDALPDDELIREEPLAWPSGHSERAPSPELGKVPSNEPLKYPWRVVWNAVA